MTTAKDRAIDKLFDAIEDCIKAGITPKEFLSETRQIWPQIYTKLAEADNYSWNLLVK